MSKRTASRWALRIGSAGTVVLGAGWASGAASAASPADLNAILSAAVGTWWDTNGDQIGDVFIAERWGGGPAYLVAIDADQNGWIEGFEVDLDGDGIRESAAVDLSGNGVFDRYAVDTDGDGWQNIIDDFNEDLYTDVVPVGSPASAATQYSTNVATINSTMIPMVYENLAAAGL
jgi:hypothetical protein